MSCARRARGTGMALQLAAATAALVTQVAGEGCGLQGGLCICEDSDGDRWDLTPLGGDHIVSGPGPSIWPYDYHFNFCDNVGYIPNNPPCLFSATAAYRIEDYEPATSATCLNMGPDIQNPAIPQEVTKIGGDAANGVSVRFSVSPTTSFTVSLACDETQQGIVTMAAAPGFLTAAVTNWETFYSCPAAQAGALSWGWPVLIVLFVSAGLYVGGGVGYNKRTNNEMSHPHQEQWIHWKGEFTSLVSDGVWFTRVQVAENIKPLSFIAPADGSSPPSKGAGEFDGLLAPGDGETATAGRSSSSRNSKKSDKKERSKKGSKDKKESSKEKAKREAKEKKETAEKETKLIAMRTGPRPGETDREAREREVREIASVEERVEDIEQQEGGSKAPKE